MSDGEDNVRQRIKTEKDALKEKVEEIRRKMKDKEASQQRKEGMLVVLKPVFFIVLAILLIGLFFYLNQDSIDTSQVEDAIEGVEVEEIIAEVEE